MSNKVIEKVKNNNKMIFVSNFFKLKEIERYEYVIRIDDDSYFREDLQSLDIFLDKISRKDCKFGSAHFWNHVGENTLQTRENLWNFTNEFVEKFKVPVKNNRLSDALKNKHEDQFHRLGWSAGNFNLYRSDMFKEKLWVQWIDLINERGYIYKNRWGDQEVIGLYY